MSRRLAISLSCACGWALKITLMFGEQSAALATGARTSAASSTMRLATKASNSAGRPCTCTQISSWKRGNCRACGPSGRCSRTYWVVGSTRGLAFGAGVTVTPLRLEPAVFAAGAGSPPVARAELAASRAAAATPVRTKDRLFIGSSLQSGGRVAGLAHGAGDGGPLRGPILPRIDGIEPGQQGQVGGRRGLGAVVGVAAVGQ